MRVLLTGASGYLGQHLLVALLDAGHHVTALVRDPARLGALANCPQVRVITADLQDHERLADHIASSTAPEGYDACVHAALIWGAPGSELGLPDTIAAARLFDAACSAGASRLVYISSTAVHRPFAPHMTEADALTPTDLYGATKAAAELFLWAACATHHARGVVLRAAPIVGPPALPGGPHRSDRRVEALVAAAARGEPLRADATEGRQLVAARDVARATLAALTTEDAEGVYLCADHHITRWADVAAHARDLAASTSALHIAPASETPPRFDTRRVEALLGGPLDSADALTEHLAHLHDLHTSQTTR